MPENGSILQGSKWNELIHEFRLVLGKSSLLDSLLPPLLFVLLNSMRGFQFAMWASLGAAVLIAALRLRRGQSLLYALAGIGSVGVAILIVWFSGRAEGYFLPNLVSGSVTLALAVTSLLVGRPLVAWTSFLARRWPLDWYWHPRVRPAYAEVTLAWMIFFAARLLLQISLYQAQAASGLAWVSFLMGWPALGILLVLSYLYGTWRLSHLKGPSVEEFRMNIPPPWVGQKRGF